MKQGLKYIIFCLVFCSNATAQQNTLIKKPEVIMLKKEEPALWYVDSIPPEKKTKLVSNKRKGESFKRTEIQTPSEPLDLSWLGVLKWLLLGLLAAAIVYFIVKGDFNFNFKRKVNEEIADDITEETKIETAEQLRNIGFEEQIQRAESQQNYRLATRLYYLWLLKKLIDGKQIKFHINKTNRDYCQEMRANKYIDDFEKCTSFYNYVWFGEFNIDEATYAKIQTQFRTLIDRFS